MPRPIACWIATLIVLASSLGARGEEDIWRAAEEIPTSNCADSCAVRLDRPRSLHSGEAAREAAASTGPRIAPASFNRSAQAPPGDPPPPPESSTIYTANQPPADPPPPTSGAIPPPPPPGPPPFNQGLVNDRPLPHSFWDRCKGWLDDCCGERASATGRCLFQSDHAFDYFSSPVTNPFLFEDPRSLTELKPLFVYAGAPSTNPIFKGGNAEFYGLQARLAVTERLSMTINELGFVTLNPFDAAAGPPGAFSQSTGFAQITLGPKYTFLRSEEWRTVMAGGLLFQIPAGSPKVFQNTGTLGLVPYLSAAKNFCLPQGWGNTNLMATTGYDFSVTNQRSQFYYLSLHWDYNIANTNRFFPFLEMNYFHYTVGGKANVPGFGFEGLGLVNFGSYDVGARDFLAIAPGLNFKLNENIQVGAAIAFPLLKQKEINDYTLTFNIIFRY